jgi:uncharacterized tellurite resistance protein B-like protein
MALLPTNVRDEVQTLEPILKSLARFDRLPVAELALTGLRQLSSAQHREFLKTLDQLILIDQQLDLFEMALRRMLTRRIAQWQGTSMNRLRSVKRPESYSRAQAIQVLISGVSYAGHPKSIEEARSSFEESWRTIPNLPPWNLLPLAKCQPEHLDVALDLLAEESAHRKKWILNAALNAVSSDGQLTPSEAEIMRAIGDSLDCPLPPWLTFPG